MTEQYNHHCLLTFAGFNWRIIGCRHGHIWIERPIEGDLDEWLGARVSAHIVTKDVDWDAYCEAAVTWDQHWALPDRGEMR